MMHLVYGLPPAALVEVPPQAVQLSPVLPGSQSLDSLPSGQADSALVLAPPGTIERRGVLAQLLRALRPGGTLTALAPKTRGGTRLRRELESLGCAVNDLPRKHYRISRATCPEPWAPGAAAIAAAIAEGAMRLQPGLDLWTQPGLFSWDRIDEGSALLLDLLTLKARAGDLAGRGADLGCGLGVLSGAVLASPAVTRLELVDLDGRAIAATQRNISDDRAQFHWLDVRAGLPFAGLDFIVMNPPFHSGGQEDVELGRVFLGAARAALRKGGALWFVANRHLPYETELTARFARVELQEQGPRFKIYRAVA